MDHNWSCWPFIIWWRWKWRWAMAWNCLPSKPNWLVPVSFYFTKVCFSCTKESFQIMLLLKSRNTVRGLIKMSFDRRLHNTGWRWQKNRVGEICCINWDCNQLIHDRKILQSATRLERTFITWASVHRFHFFHRPLSHSSTLRSNLRSPIISTENNWGIIIWCISST